MQGVSGCQLRKNLNLNKATFNIIVNSKKDFKNLAKVVYTVFCKTKRTETDIPWLQNDLATLISGLKGGWNWEEIKERTAIGKICESKWP